MKLSGTAALYTQRKGLQDALAVTDKQIAMAEQFSGEASAKKARRKRQPKAQPFDVPPGIHSKSNGLDEADAN